MGKINEYPISQTIGSSDNIVSIVGNELKLVPKSVASPEIKDAPTAQSIEDTDKIVTVIDGSVKLVNRSTVAPSVEDAASASTIADTDKVVTIQNGVTKLVNRSVVAPPATKPRDYSSSSTIADSDKIVTVIDGVEKLVARSVVAPSVTSAAATNVITDTDKIVTVQNGAVKLVPRGNVDTKPGNPAVDAEVVTTRPDAVLGANLDGTSYDLVKVSTENFLDGIDPATYTEVTDDSTVETVLAMNEDDEPIRVPKNKLIKDIATYPTATSVTDADKIVTVQNGAVKLVTREKVDTKPIDPSTYTAKTLVNVIGLDASNNAGKQSISSILDGIDPTTYEEAEAIAQFQGMDSNGNPVVIDVDEVVPKDPSEYATSTSIVDTDKVMIYQNGEPKLINRGLVDTKPVDPSDYPEVQTITDSDKILAVIDGEPMLVNRGFVDTKPGTQPADYPIKTGVTYVFGLDQNGDPSKVTKANLLNGVDPTTYSEITSKASVDTVQVIDTNGAPKVIDVDTLVPDPIDPADYPVSTTIADTDKIVTVINGEAKLVNRSTVASGGIDPSTLETLDFIDTVVGMDLDGEVGKIDFTTAVETEITTSPVSTTIADTDKVVTVINNEVKLVNKSAIGGGGSGSVDAFDVTYTPTGTTTQSNVGTALDLFILEAVPMIQTIDGYTKSDEIITDKFEEAFTIDTSDYILTETSAGLLEKVTVDDLTSSMSFDKLSTSTLSSSTHRVNGLYVQAVNSSFTRNRGIMEVLPTLTDPTKVLVSKGTNASTRAYGTIGVSDLFNDTIAAADKVTSIEDTDEVLAVVDGEIKLVPKSAIGGGGSGTPSRDITWSAYQNLTQEEKMSDTDFYVTGAPGGGSSDNKDIDILDILEHYDGRMTVLDYTTKLYGNMVFAVVYCSAAKVIPGASNTIFKTKSNVASFKFCYGDDTSWNNGTKSINRSSSSTMEIGDGYMFAFCSKLVEEG